MGIDAEGKSLESLAVPLSCMPSTDHAVQVS
jgi:hypothetical protein